MVQPPAHQHHRGGVRRTRHTWRRERGEKLHADFVLKDNCVRIGRVGTTGVRWARREYTGWVR
jgi:hypothetical protein